MTHTSRGTRSLVRIGVSAMIGALLVATTMLPADAGAPPSISGFNPGSGSVGTGVTITGANFLGTTKVKFNSTLAVGFIVDVSGTQITTTVPSGASTGPITVRTSQGTAVSAASFVLTGGPTISGFSPSSGPVGTSVSINGTNLNGATSVTFDGTNAAGFSVNGSGTQINATVPGGATTGKIKVTTPSGTATSATHFVVTSSAGPTITSFNPTFGPVGTSVTINGSHFTGVTQVKFHGVVASFSFGSDTRVTATVPPGATTGKITLMTPAGSASSPTAFQVVTPTAPHITGFNPNSGSVGTSVRITGSGFLGTTVVRFHGTAVSSFVVVNDGKITTTVPSGATTGKISVTNPRGTDTSGTSFHVSGPKITSFSPTTGTAGTVVTIFGSSFTGVNGVKFNGKSAASFSFVNDGTVTAVVPSGATTGKIKLSTPSGTATSNGNFTVLSPHRRSISLSLTRRRLVATGHVNVNDGYSACSSFVPVVIVRFRHGSWHWITTTSTRSDGVFRTFIPDRRGAYRARAKRIVLVNGAICVAARSNIVHRR
jgi:large repetitive protein